jgi:hypothetical protein
VTTPLSEQQLAEIRADLAAVPAPPWRWIGVRGAGGPQLVTDHSGRQYLLRAKKPADRRGDEVLDPQTDYPVYGDLEFRDQRPGERTRRCGPATSSHRPHRLRPGLDRRRRQPGGPLGGALHAHAAALLAEVERLQATAPSVWHAWPRRTLRPSASTPAATPRWTTSTTCWPARRTPLTASHRGSGDLAGG